MKDKINLIKENSRKTFRFKRAPVLFFRIERRSIFFYRFRRFTLIWALFTCDFYFQYTICDWNIYPHMIICSRYVDPQTKFVFSIYFLWHLICPFGETYVCVKFLNGKLFKAKIIIYFRGTAEYSSSEVISGIYFYLNTLQKTFPRIFGEGGGYLSATRAAISRLTNEEAWKLNNKNSTYAAITVTHIKFLFTSS